MSGSVRTIADAMDILPWRVYAAQNASDAVGADEGPQSDPNAEPVNMAHAPVDLKDEPQQPEANDEPPKPALTWKQYGINKWNRIDVHVHSRYGRIYVKVMAACFIALIGLILLKSTIRWASQADTTSIEPCNSADMVVGYAAAAPFLPIYLHFQIPYEFISHIPELIRMCWRMIEWASNQFVRFILCICQTLEWVYQTVKPVAEEIARFLFEVLLWLLWIVWYPVAWLAIQTWSALVYAYSHTIQPFLEYVVIPIGRAFGNVWTTAGAMWSANIRWWK